jgi:alkylation response protein AidB-like acyl-CoA dehydrogenase
MGIELPPEAEAFREDARRFVAEHSAAATETRRAHLVDSGYLVPHWPKPYGRAAGAVEQLVIDEELRNVDMPNLGIGGWVLLTVTQTANDEQRARWVKAGLLGQVRWCQLFSEPNAGSDAAAVQTRGVKVDGGWRVTGQKVWTSNAHLCDRGLATIRTDPRAPKHKGITTMVIDLHAAGVEVRPLREITGGSLFNEVFFDNVFVPDEDVVGDVNNGWRVVRTTLGNERVAIGGSSDDRFNAHSLLAMAYEGGCDDVEKRRRIARLVVMERAIRLMNLRRVTRAVAAAEPGPEGSITKLLAANHVQRVTEAAMEFAQLTAVVGGRADIAHEYFVQRCSTIAGGTTEITLNVIAERILGLPRDPLVT